MGLIFDTLVLIANERRKFDMLRFLRRFGDDTPIIAAITVSELLHGGERAKDAELKLRWEKHVKDIISLIDVPPQP